MYVPPVRYSNTRRTLGQYPGTEQDHGAEDWIAAIGTGISDIIGAFKGQPRTVQPPVAYLPPPEPTILGLPPTVALIGGLGLAWFLMKRR